MLSRELFLSALYLFGPVSLRGSFHSGRRALRLELVRTTVALRAGATPPALTPRAVPGRHDRLPTGPGPAFPGQRFPRPVLSGGHLFLTAGRPEAALSPGLNTLPGGHHLLYARLLLAPGVTAARFCLLSPGSHGGRETPVSPEWARRHIHSYTAGWKREEGHVFFSPLSASTSHVILTAREAA